MSAPWIDPGWKSPAEVERLREQARLGEEASEKRARKQTEFRSNMEAYLRDLTRPRPAPPNPHDPVVHTGRLDALEQRLDEHRRWFDTLVLRLLGAGVDVTEAPQSAKETKK